MNPFATKPFNRVSSLFLFLFLMVASSKSSATNYYIDPSGNDGNSGTSAVAAWQTLAKVSATTFSAGDTIFFKAGGVWSGQAWPKGSGVSGNPIVVDMYGTGNKPVINGPGTNGSAAFFLQDVSYWEVNNLEVTNYRLAGVDTAQLSGIYVRKSGATALTNITIKNCFVHDVYSQTFGKPNYGKITGGIIITGGPINNVLVQGCHVKNVQVEGIRTNNGSSRSNNVVFDNNLIENVYGDGIVMSGVQNGSAITNNTLRNVAITNDANFAGAWTISSTGTTVAFNEVYDCTGGLNDGEAFDADLTTDGDIFEYNYSHNNKGGFMLLMPSAQNIIVRYNISQNDGNGTELFHYTNNTYSTNLIYNNSFYIGTGLSTTFFRDGSSSGKTVNFYNNIVQCDGTITAFASGTFTASTLFKNNCFYPASITSASGAPAQTAPVLANPQLANAGGAGVGVNTAGVYQLKSTSPCINAGVTVASNGGRDFWNNALYYNSSADIGAHEYSGSTVSSPAVTITSPANNATLPVGNVTIDATASDTDGSISKVEFYEGYNLLGEDVAAPYSFTWSGATQGGHTLTAKAIDNDGNATSASINITVASISDTLFIPAADAYVRDGSYANTNYGTGTTMAVKADAAGYNRQSYLRFNYAAFPDATTSSALLRIYASGVNTAPSRVISVYGIADTTWGENTITWNNKPTAGTLLGTITVTNQAGQWYQLDVTSYIQSNMATKRVSFRLVNEAAPSATNDVSFNTKEAASNQPQLFIAKNQSQPEKDTIGTIADAYVRDGNFANNNYGANTTMQVKSDASGFTRNSYLKFDYNSFIGSNAASALLRVYASSVNTDASRVVSVYGITDTSWGESTITWNNKPVAGTLLGTFTITNQAGVWYEFDVTSYIQNNMSTKKVSFRLVNEGAAGSKNDVTFNTKEAGSSRPQLVISGSAQPGGRIRTPASGMTLSGQVATQSLMAYPNPVRGILHLQAPEPKGVIRLIDLTGKVLQQVLVTNTNVTMNVQAVCAGMYLISYCINNKVVVSQKVMIQ